MHKVMQDRSSGSSHRTHNAWVFEPTPQTQATSTTSTTISIGPQNPCTRPLVVGNVAWVQGSWIMDRMDHGSFLHKIQVRQVPSSYPPVRDMDPNDNVMTNLMTNWMTD